MGNIVERYLMAWKSRQGSSLYISMYHTPGWELRVIGMGNRWIESGSKSWLRLGPSSGSDYSRYITEPVSKFHKSVVPNGSRSCILVSPSM